VQRKRWLGQGTSWLGRPCTFDIWKQNHT
jgi:hypothetical protein